MEDMGAATARPLRVVLVDDDAIVRLATGRLLQREPDVELVASCEDGPSGLRALIDHGPDVAILDHFMPGLDGLEVARQARAQGVEAALVLVTGARDELSDAALEEAGIDLCLEKGVASPRAVVDRLPGLARAVRSERRDR
jgi:CitB family two-component system response regulator MalR/two-component system response regulator DctR